MRSLGNMHFFARVGVSLTNAAWQAQLRAEVERLDVGLIILDPWAELIDGLSENDNSEVRAMIKFARTLAESTGATPKQSYASRRRSDCAR